MSNEPYHNEGFGWAFLWICIMFLVLPTIIVLSIDDGWEKYANMRGFGGDCWENSKHEKVCKNNNTCKFGRNFCIEEVYRWRAE
jgi:ABC-type spermidine/putrescine transport system permease subunit II